MSSNDSTTAATYSTNPDSRYAQRNPDSFGSLNDSKPHISYTEAKDFDFAFLMCLLTCVRPEKSEASILPFLHPTAEIPLLMQLVLPVDSERKGER